MDFTSLLNIIPPAQKPSRIFNLTGSSAALLLALCDRPFLAVESTDERAMELAEDTAFFCKCLQKDSVLFFPEPDGPALSGERAKAIRSLTGRQSLITSFQNLGLPVWSPDELRNISLTLKKGMEIRRSDIEDKLREMGYQAVSLVVEKGEYSRRGWLFDVFPSTSDAPVRLELFGDEIEAIKSFDVDTQKSAVEQEDLLILPVREPSSGSSLLDIASPETIFCSETIHEKTGLPDNTFVLSPYSFEGDGLNAGMLSIKGLGILPEERKSIDELPARLRPLISECKTILAVSSRGQAERLRDILRDGDLVAPFMEKQDIFEYEGSISMTTGTLSSGLFMPGLLILTEKEIFGGRPKFRPIRKSKVSALLTSLDDLMPGDFVVHKDHGIGKFIGLVRQNVEGIEEDLLLIAYEGSKLYIPLQNINAIHKYHAEENVLPGLDRLGGKTWQRTKARARKKIEDMAGKLLAIYAEREVHKGFTFSPDTELHREFDSFFPYEETPDQLKAVADIKTDMESDRPMERLICGDVGYGKTEVAMRAAFKAVYDGLQVAVLVPTTILCEQHFRTFSMRFSAFPVRIDHMSRFKSGKEQKETVRALAHGDIDIIIGTHSLLRKDISFYKLGLLIIDEEHRFGVKQKENIKEFKRGVDVLSLTATPIPRTLQMAVSDIRDMSVIETPPEERLSVRSIVSVFRETLISEAIQRELNRKGQVFFVHNRIKDIYEIGGLVTKLVPSATTAVAHGQMSEQELENIMIRFYDGEIDILVSTAIIGSGIDVPSANTIIINRADRMGLADLYQLRGRVGRSNSRAYSYFLIPGEDIITAEAKKRLQAIQEMSYLGAGFRLAMKDLEIRGAGNLLGSEQSGHIHAVGFDLYIEMLEKAVAELKGMPAEEEFEPEIRLRVNAFIPESYIEDMTLRLSLYRRIAASRTDDMLAALDAETEDRFGRMPVEVRHLIDVMRLKVMARQLRIAKIVDTRGYVRVIFSPDTKVETDSILKPHDKLPGKIRFLPDGFELNIEKMQWLEACDKIRDILKQL
jgi:transcription-repair coupling factor (superfamily II helicase)